MVAVNIKAFRGMIPRTSPRLLQPNQATRARNVKLTSGRLDPLKGLTALASVPALTRTIYRYRYYTESGGSVDNWLTWTSDVDAVASSLARDSRGSLYFTSADFEPRMTTYVDAVAGTAYPAAWFALGLPLPTQQPSVAVTGGTSPSETRSYAYTFVSRYGEESGPSPASAVVTGNANGTWTVSELQAAPPNSGAVAAVQNNVPGVGRVTLTLSSVFGLAPFDTITIAGATGMTDLNASHRLLSVDAATNKVVIALTTAQAYGGAASWSRNAPLNTADMTKRIYRSAGTEAQFLFVAEIPAGQTTYVDTAAAANLGEVIPTLNSLPPPKNLSCLASLPNGCMVGLADNELCFSEPYMPYSWPQSNRYSFSGQGVALCPVGNSVVVLTDSYPILFTGSDPEAMSPSTMETYAPCVSKRGVVNVGGGCLYPSFDGLWLATAGRVENITKNLYREAEWAKLNPPSFIADIHDGQYLASYLPEGAISGGVLVMDIAERDSVTEVEDTFTAMMRSEYDGKLYVLRDDRICLWEGDDSVRYSCDWISAVLQMPKPLNFAVAQVHADFETPVPPDTAQIAANEALIAQGPDTVAGWLGGGELLAYEINGSYIAPAFTGLSRKVQFTLYADGVPVFSSEIDSSTPFRLPAGYVSEVFSVGLNASVPVYSVAMAQSVSELAQAS